MKKIVVLFLAIAFALSTFEVVYAQFIKTTPQATPTTIQQKQSSTAAENKASAVTEIYESYARVMWMKKSHVENDIRQYDKRFAFTDCNSDLVVVVPMTKFTPMYFLFDCGGDYTIDAVLKINGGKNIWDNGQVMTPAGYKEVKDFDKYLKAAIDMSKQWVEALKFEIGKGNVKYYGVHEWDMFPNHWIFNPDPWLENSKAKAYSAGCFPSMKENSKYEFIGSYLSVYLETVLGVQSGNSVAVQELWDLVIKKKITTKNYYGYDPVHVIFDGEVISWGNPNVPDVAGLMNMLTEIMPPECSDISLPEETL